jgi:hypothetical protein
MNRHTQLAGRAVGRDAFKGIALLGAFIIIVPRGGPLSDYRGGGQKPSETGRESALRIFGAITRPSSSKASPSPKSSWSASPTRSAAAHERRSETTDAIAHVAKVAITRQVPSDFDSQITSSAPESLKSCWTRSTSSDGTSSITSRRGDNGV